MKPLNYRFERRHVDVEDLMLRFAFDATCMMVFGLDTNCLSSELPVIPFAEAVENSFDCSGFRIPCQKQAKQWAKGPYEVYELSTHEKAHISEDVLAQILVHIFIAKFKDAKVAKARSTIRLHLAESVYFTIVGESTAKAVWDKLCANYENKSASNKVYLMKKLFDLCMKEGGTVSGHLNEFNIIFSQLTLQGLNFDEEIKCIFLLCNLPLSWDKFCTAISNSAPNINLMYNDVVGSLVMKEIRRKSLEPAKQGDAYVASGKGQRGHTQNCAKSKDCKNSCSKSRGSLRNGHLKKDCYAWQRDRKKLTEEKSDNDVKGKGKIEELNVVESPKSVDMHGVLSPSDVLVFTADFSADALVEEDASFDQNWVIDSGASFHVTPHREWFSTSAHTRGIVNLGDAYELDIHGVEDIKLVLHNGTEFVLRDVKHVPKLAKIPIIILNISSIQ
ncbi:hypothetical protein L7F22_047881 [Adiantum nelumboides]|nr:hypothetical protein [Adiantum nelumboides]